MALTDKELHATRELVAQACRILGTLNLTKETSGHVSMRLENSDRILIRARGPGESGVRYTTAEDIISVDLNGKKIEGRAELTPPQEIFIHTWLYKIRPETASVIHIHPATVVLFTICNKPLLPIYGAYDPSSLRLLLEGIPTFPKSILISNDARGEEFAQVMGNKRTCLMRGHGITVAGRSVQEATITAIKLNELAEMNYRAALLGNPEPIQEEDIQSFKQMWQKSSGSAHEQSTWRYYVRLVEGA